MSALTPAELARKWLGNTRTERAASQEHFIDLCRMLGAQTPNEADPTGRVRLREGREQVHGGRLRRRLKTWLRSPGVQGKAQST